MWASLLLGETHTSGRQHNSESCIAESIRSQLILTGAVRTKGDAGKRAHGELEDVWLGHCGLRVEGKRTGRQSTLKRDVMLLRSGSKARSSVWARVMFEDGE